MSFVTSLKVVRLLLAVCVSVWLAGGCVLGCSNMAMAAQAGAKQSSEAAVEGESCHTARSHDCCSKAKPAKQSTIDPRQTESLPGLASLPRGMSDCPLVVNSTAITSKNNGNSPDPAYATNAALPPSAAKGELPQKHVVAPLVPNRGPTYLRCCVLLI